MSENKSFLETVSQTNRPESFSKEVFVPVSNGKKMQKITIFAAAILFFTIIVLVIYMLSRNVTMENLVGRSISDASIWAKKNDMVLAVKNTYNFENDEGIVLVQEYIEGDKIKKGTTITLQVSAGPDPEEAFEFPDIMNMDGDEIEAWVEENKLTGVKITTESSTIIAENHVIEYSFTDGDEESFLRKNRLSIVLSTGPEEEGDTVVVSDFSAMSVGKILQWAEENEIVIQIVEENSQYFEKGSVISQSVKSNEEIFKNETITVVVSLGAPEEVPDFSAMNIGKILQWGTNNNIPIYIQEEFSDYFGADTVISQSVQSGTELTTSDPITVVVSLGKAVVIPDFSFMTKEEASSWAKEEGVSIYSSEKYNGSLGKGKLISQSISQGMSVKTGADIKLVYSLGKIDVTSFIGKTKLDILSWQTEVNNNGAGIVLNFKEDYGGKNTSGKILSQSLQETQVNPGTTIDITISKGVIIMVPDFSGLSETECNTLANSMNVTVQYRYQTSTTIDQGYIITQSPIKGSLVPDSTTIIITISSSEVNLDTVVVPDFSSMKASEILKWGTDNEITIQLYEVSNSFITSGNVVSQSVSKDTVIKKKSTISVAISSGKATSTSVDSATVPNFSNLTDAEATSWAKNAGVTLTIIDQYSDTYSKGKLFSQSMAYETTIYEGDELKVYRSLGKITVSSYAGKTKLDVLSWQQDVNAKGGSITINFNNSYGAAGSVGKILSQTVTNDTIPLNGSVNFDVSLGMKIIIPDLEGKTKAECEAVASGLGLKLIFDYAHDNIVASGDVISQSLQADSVSTDEVSMTVVISLGP